MADSHGWGRVVAALAVAAGVFALWWILTQLAVEALHRWQWRHRSTPGYPAHRRPRPRKPGR